jgi:RimJ/RimL family protein N-acetyltransferase
MLGIKVARFPLSIRNETVTLRRSRFRDLFRLFAFFTPELLLQMNGRMSEPDPKAFRSVLSFYRWLRATFQLVYIIETQKISGVRTILGFVGLYDVELGQRLYLTIAIFTRENRQQGYGRQALELLLQSLRETGLVKTVSMEVLRTNLPSLSLCNKLGFVVRYRNETTTLFEKQLSAQS